MELNLKEILNSKKRNFYLVSSRERDIDIFMEKSITSVDKDVCIRIIRGQRCKTTENLFQEFAAALQFPYWFVYHWQSFDDCMSDPSGRQAKESILFITNFDKLLSDSPEELKLFFIFLKDAVVEWGKKNKYGIIEHQFPLHVILHCESENETKCKKILKNENIEPILKILKPYDDRL